MKLSPYFSAVGNMAEQLDRAGASALVLFNRFYQPDIDLTRLRMTKDLDLSKPARDPAAVVMDRGAGRPCRCLTGRQHRCRDRR